MELSARAADDAASVGRWRGGEEGMDPRGLGDVHFALTLTQSAVSSSNLMGKLSCGMV